MKKLAFLALAVALISFGAAHAHADNSPVSTGPSISISTDETTVVDPNQDLLDQLAYLQKQYQNPENGPISKFFIGLKIREVKNKLALKQALK